MKVPLVMMVPLVPLVAQVMKVPLVRLDLKVTGEREERKEIVVFKVLLIILEVCTFAGGGLHVLITLELNWSTLEELGGVLVVLTSCDSHMILNIPQVVLLEE